MTASPLRRRLAALEAVALQRGRFVVFVQTDQTDPQALRAQALADGIDLALLPLGTLLARARLTPAEMVERDAKRSGRQDNEYLDPGITKEEQAAIDAVDTMHVERRLRRSGFRTCSATGRSCARTVS